MVQKLIVNQYYFHSIIHGYEKSLETIESIIKDGYIKSPSSRGLEQRKSCCKSTEICLAEKIKNKDKKKYVSCMDIYLPRLTTFVIDKQVKKTVKIIRPRIITTEEAFNNYGKFDNATNLCDELRAVGDISLEYVKGISVPYNGLINDPYFFFTFFDEQVLMDSYNGVHDSSLLKSIRAEFSDEKHMLQRKEYVEAFIVELSSKVNKNGLNIPLYNYDSSNPHQLVKR